MYILNLLKFDFDSVPLFYDVIEIFMAQGLLFTTDQQIYEGETRLLIPDTKTVTLLERYIDFFSLLALQDAKMVNTNAYLIACAIVSSARKLC